MSKDVFDIMRQEFGVGNRHACSLRVDGGACRNNFLMQFQADILGCNIVRPKNVDSTAFGVAQLAGVRIGLWNGKKDLKKLHKTERTFVSRMNSKTRKDLYDGWLNAIAKAKSEG